MTILHIFYIPTIFLLGLVFGTLINKKGANISNSIEESIPKKQFQTKTSKTQFIQTFLIFLLVFIATHMFELPWSSKAISHLIGDLEIFDKSPVFSSTEVYKRLSLFPDEALIAYKRFTYTMDIIFPLSLFTFLFTFTRFVSQRITIPNLLKTVLVGLPFFWFAFDLIENAVIFNILSKFPIPIEFLAGSLGFITAIKFGLLLLSIFTPSFLFIFIQKSEAN